MALKSRDGTSSQIRTCFLVAVATAPSDLQHERQIYQLWTPQKKKKKGFSSQAERFPSALCLDELPGPGSYSCSSSFNINNPSFSKKGTTGFVASKAPRRPRGGVPAPNAYNLQSSLINKHDFSAGASGAFRLPVAVLPDGAKHRTPAPNQYDVSRAARFSSVAVTSPFLSQTAREPVCVTTDGPPPGHYEVSHSLIRRSSPAVSSPFRSKTQRLSAAADHRVPGPGAYSPHQPPAAAHRTPPLRKCVVIAAPPRAVPKDPPPPGPGHYDIGSSDRTSKRSMPTAAFASRTGRMLPSSRADGTPGPGLYNPHAVPKQSFLYPNARVWVPF
ncbi:O(6)-methylguanine-induced apoptosis 2 [Leuresthes tenuis]|uniref:O(6)-methylguanine-induced apoptosis 2 n=1 Tax=Leuresthes tenuis TaxID=355514 RepID=UPI003B5084D9